MGYFSRIYSDTGKNVVIGKIVPTFLLVPPSFQAIHGKSIYELCYKGYGRYGNYDVYELVAQWNKSFIPDMIEKIREGVWEAEVDEQDIADLQAYYEGKPITCEERDIGILMACYDEDNERLPNPIKITSMEMEYDAVPPSKNDPMQGCR